MSGGVFIDGKSGARGGSGATLGTDPTTGEVIWREATATRPTWPAVEAARKAFPAWADQPREERIAILRRYKECWWPAPPPSPRP
jgi:succinylglutamic semialdehyde dehydrogenase